MDAAQELTARTLSLPTVVMPESVCEVVVLAWDSQVPVLPFPALINGNYPRPPDIISIWEHY